MLLYAVHVFNLIVIIVRFFKASKAFVLLSLLKIYIKHNFFSLMLRELFLYIRNGQKQVMFTLYIQAIACQP